MIEHWIGMTIRATTTPAMNVEAVYTVSLASGLFGIGAGDLEDRDPARTSVDSHRDRPITWPWKRNRPHSP